MIEIMLLKDKNIVITGSGRGIGREIAIACAKEGANIGLTSRTIEELDETKEKITSLGNGVKTVVKTADITKYDEVEKIFKEFRDELGLLDGVVANAGWSRKSVTHEFEPEKFSAIIDINVDGVFHSFKAAYPHLNKENKKDKARFIITGSAAYLTPMPKFAAYTASKYAVVGLMNSLDLEYHSENITFNMLVPTMVDTRLLRGSKAGDGNKPPTVMDPWELNEYYLFLLSESGNKVSGQLVDPSDFNKIKELIAEAPVDKKEDWDIFKEYMEEKSPGYFKSLKKLKKLGQFLFSRK